MAENGDAGFNAAGFIADQLNDDNVRTTYSKMRKLAELFLSPPKKGDSEWAAIVEEAHKRLLLLADVNDRANSYVSDFFTAQFSMQHGGIMGEFIENGCLALGSRPGKGKPAIKGLFIYLGNSNIREAVVKVLKTIAQANPHDVEDVMNDFARQWQKKMGVARTVREIRLHVRACKPDGMHENLALQIMRSLRLFPARKAHGVDVQQPHPLGSGAGDKKARIG